MSNTWTHSEDKKLIEHIRDNFADGKVIASYMASDLGRTEASIESRISLIRRYWRGDVVLSALPRGLAEALAEAGKPVSSTRKRRPPATTGRKYPVRSEKVGSFEEFGHILQVTREKEALDQLKHETEKQPEDKPDRAYQAVVIAAFAAVLSLCALIFAIMGAF